MTALFRLVILALVLANMAIAALFWSEFSADPIKGPLFTLIGTLLVLVEVTALVVASRAAARGEFMKAWTGRTIWILLLAVNLAADIGAIAVLFAADDQKRGADVIAYDRTDDAIKEAEGEILRLRAALDASGITGSADSLRARAEAEQAAMGRSRIVTPAEERRVGQLLEAAALAQEISEWQARKRTAESKIDTLGPRPEETHPQFDALSRMINWGLPESWEVSVHDVRVGLAILLAIVLKVCVSLGLWVAESAPRGERAGRKSAPPPEAPLRPAARTRTIPRVLDAAPVSAAPPVSLFTPSPAAPAPAPADGSSRIDDLRARMARIGRGGADE